jgi:hypothetical protein
MGERNLMRKRITLLIAALMLALSMSFGGVGPAGITVSMGASTIARGRRLPVGSVTITTTMAATITAAAITAAATTMTNG